MEYFYFLGLYLALLLLLGLHFSRRMKSLEDFFLASRSLRAPLIYLSLTASWFGATSILVTTDESFKVGISAFWLIGLPALVTVLVFALFLARPIRRLNILTVPDLVELRYGKTVRHLASLLILWYLVVFASSQMVALGNFLRPFLGLSYFLCLILATGVVLVYTVSGGFRSVVFADSLQFFLLASGICGLGVYLFSASSPAAILQAAALSGRENLFDFFHDLPRNVLIALSFTLAWIISPVVWQRIQAARTEGDAQRGLLLTGGTFIPLYGFVVLIGILSLPFLSSSDLRHPLLSEIILSGIGLLGGGLLFVAVLAAILSTMDTAINTGALTLTRDLYEKALSGTGMRPLTPILVSRLATVIVTGMALAIATRFQSILQTLGLASEIMAEGLFVPGISMIFLKKKLPLAGGLSLGLGGLFALASFLGEVGISPFHLPSWPMSLPYGLGLSLVGFVLGALLEQRHQKSSTAPP